jgi:hypothetical protein
MGIGIVTVSKTTLTIDTSGMSELLNLEQMGSKAAPVSLKPGVKNEITVEAGAYRVLSNCPVSVSADTSDTRFVSLNKDPPPDQPKLTLGEDIHRFFAATAALGESAPT